MLSELKHLSTSVQGVGRGGVRRITSHHMWVDRTHLRGRGGRRSRWPLSASQASLSCSRRLCVYHASFSLPRCSSFLSPPRLARCLCLYSSLALRSNAALLRLGAGDIAAKWKLFVVESAGAENFLEEMRPLRKRAFAQSCGYVRNAGHADSNIASPQTLVFLKP